MKYVNKFNKFKINENNRLKLDYDYILNKIKDFGWGDISPLRLEDFEESSYFTDPISSDLYVDELNSYLKAYSEGELE